MDTIDEFTHKGFDVSIEYDECANSDPFEELGFLGMFAFMKDNLYDCGYHFGKSMLDYLTIQAAAANILFYGENSEPCKLKCYELTDEEEFYEEFMLTEVEKKCFGNTSKLKEKDYNEYIEKLFGRYYFWLPISIRDFGSNGTQYYPGKLNEWDPECQAIIFIARQRTAWELFGMERGLNSKRLRNYTAKMLKAEIKIYQYWVNGETYGFTIEDTKGCLDDNSAWGFYGMEDVAKCAKDEIDNWLFKERRSKLLAESIKRKMSNKQSTTGA